jgi:general secretion pathway protein L
MSKLYFEKALGIDFREESVSLAVLGVQWKTPEIVATHHFRLAKPLATGDAESEQFVIDEIKRFLEQSEFSSGRVAVSLPRNKAGFHFFELPAPELEMVGAMVGFELERHLCAAPENFYYTYHAVRSSGTHHRLTLETVRKETLDYYLNLLSRLPLKPQTMDGSTFANLAILFSAGYQARGFEALVDAGQEGFEVTLIDAQNPIYTQKTEVKSTAVKNAYPLAPDDLPAEEIERLGKEYAQEIIAGILETLGACDQMGGDGEIRQIHLFHGGPFADVLVRTIGEETGVAVRRVSLSCPTAPGMKTPFDPGFTVTACGLALRELKPSPIETNLLPQALRPKKKRTNLKTSIVLAGIAAILAIGAVTSHSFFKARRLETLEKELKEIQVKAAPLEKIDREQEEVKLYVDLLAGIQSKNPRKLPLLEQLTQILPPHTWVTEIIFAKNEIKVKGVSAKASDLVPILEQSPYFKSTQFNGSIVNSPEGERFALQTVPEAQP